MGELFSHGRIRNVPMERVPLSPDERAATLLQSGDLLFARQSLVLSGAGKCCLFLGDEEEVVFESHIIRIRVDARKADPAFLYYYFASPDGRSAIESIVEQGAGASGIRGSDLARLSLNIPDLHTQQAISDLLGSIDDKIELNRHLNKTLEAVARAIFKDWFVDFGPTRAKMEGRAPYLAPDVWNLFPDQLDKEGKPQGWKHSTLGAEFRLTMGQSPPGDTYNKVGDGLPFLQGCTDFGDRYPKRRVYCTAASRIAELDDTLVSVRAPVGDINMAWERCCIGRGVAAVRHLSGNRGYTHYALSQLQPQLSAFEHSGTVFGAINKAQFEELNVIAPSTPILNAFEGIVQPFDDHIRGNVFEVTTLTKMRDLLLPKLMSDEIRIKDAEKSEVTPFLSADLHARAVHGRSR